MGRLALVGLLVVTALVGGDRLLDPRPAKAQPIAGATYVGTHSGGGSFTLTVSEDGSSVTKLEIGDVCALESVLFGSTGEGVGSTIAVFAARDDAVVALLVSTGLVIHIENHAFAYEGVDISTVTQEDVNLNISFRGSFPNQGSAEGTFSVDYAGSGSSGLGSCSSGTLRWSATTAALPPTPPALSPTPSALPSPPCPSGSECIALVAGCQIVTSTEDLMTATLRQRFYPEYKSAWLLEAATGTWLGDSPAAGAAMQGPNDLPGVDKLDGFFACMPDGGGTFERALV